jgi:hypothetical protein
MTSKRIGLAGFDRMTGLHLVGPAEAFSAAALDNGYGGRIPCYEVSIIGVNSDRFQAESGVTFTGESDLQGAAEFDTIIIAGGSGSGARCERGDRRGAAATRPFDQTDRRGLHWHVRPGAHGSVGWPGSYGSLAFRD